MKNRRTRRLAAPLGIHSLHILDPMKLPPNCLSLSLTTLSTIVEKLVGGVLGRVLNLVRSKLNDPLARTFGLGFTASHQARGYTGDVGCGLGGAGHFRKVFLLIRPRIAASEAALGIGFHIGLRGDDFDTRSVEGDYVSKVSQIIRLLVY